MCVYKKTIGRLEIRFIYFFEKKRFVLLFIAFDNNKVPTDIAVHA